MKLKPFLIVLLILITTCQFFFPLFSKVFPGVSHGIDFLTYSTAPKVFNLGLNPYVKENLVLLKNFSDITLKILSDPNNYGFTGTIVTLIIFYPFSLSLNLGADIAIILFNVFSIIVLIGIFTLFVLRTLKINLFIDKLFVISIIGFIITSFPPAIYSVMILGQIEAIYLLPLILGIYWSTSKKDKLVFFASFLITLSSAIKLFPAIIIFYFIFKNILFLRSLEKKTIKIYLSHSSSKMVLGFILSAIFLLVVSILFIKLHGFNGSGLLGSFIEKLKMEFLKQPESMVLFKFFPGLLWLLSGIGLSFSKSILIGILPIIGVLILAVTGINKEFSEERITMESAMVLTLLPLLMFHWKAYYNVIMLCPLIITFIYSLKILELKNKLLNIGGVFFSYVFIGSAFAMHLFPWFLGIGLSDVGIYNISLKFFYIMFLPAVFVLFMIIRKLLMGDVGNKELKDFNSKIIKEPMAVS